MDATPAAADTDTATVQTVERMADYIGRATKDDRVRACADYAWRRFGCGSEALSAKAWGVFFWCKHSVRFRTDEATMRRVGLNDEQDLLIEPALLVRMLDPAEDCDGFTMLGAALLTLLGVPCYLITVAADPSDRERWSHIFLVAVTEGGYLPMDISHGKGPGLRSMVPRGQIYRWQAWSPQGELAPLTLDQVDLRAYSRLHGYVRASGPSLGARPRYRRRGVGQDPTDPFADISSTGYTPADITSVSYGPSLATPPFSPAAPAAGGVNWTQLFGSLGASTAGALSRVFAPPAYQQTVRDPITGQILSTTVSAFATPSTGFTVGAGVLGSSSMPWILGGLALVGLAVAFSKK